MARGEPGTVIASAGGMVVVEVGGVDADAEQRVALEVDGLEAVCLDLPQAAHCRTASWRCNACRWARS